MTVQFSILQALLAVFWALWMGDLSFRALGIYQPKVTSVISLDGARALYILGFLLNVGMLGHLILRFQRIVERIRTQRSARSVIAALGLAGGILFLTAPLPLAASFLYEAVNMYQAIMPSATLLVWAVLVFAGLWIELPEQTSQEV